MSKAWNIVRTVFTWIVVAIAIIMMIFTIISVTTVDKNNRSLFGFKLFKVMSDSMKATDFEAGDIVLSREVDVATLKEGDIISFESMDDDSLGEVITHKIKRIIHGEWGLSFVTYGTTTGIEDSSTVAESQILGKYVGRIPKLGYFFNFLSTTPGYISCILVPFMLLILSQAISSIKLFKRYKREQTAEIETEKEQVASERAEMQHMMAELLAMKSQMMNNTGASPVTPTPQPAQVTVPQPGPVIVSQPAQVEMPQPTPTQIDISTPSVATADTPDIAKAKSDLAAVTENLEQYKQLKEKLEFTLTFVDGERAEEISEKLKSANASIVQLQSIEQTIKAKLGTN